MNSTTMSSTPSVDDSSASSAQAWPVDAATVLNSLCGYSSFALFCLTLPLFLPLALILPGGRRRWIAVAMRFAMRWVFRVTPTVSWRCDGNLQALAAARVVVANHEGMLDILAACSLTGTRTLLAKTWVFRAFPLGVAARAAGLYNSDALTPEDYQEGAALTLPDSRVGIFVFPEGSRSRDGAIHRFRPGAFVLAKHLDVPVVPVVVAGSRLGIRPGSLWIHPSQVHSRVLAPMRPQAEESHRQFAARVRDLLECERYRLMVEMLRSGSLARHRRHRSAGLPASLRRAITDEERSASWQILLELPFATGGWLFLGSAWSTMPLTVRMLYPEVAIHLVEAVVDQLVVARHQWLQDSDRIAATFNPATLPDVSTVVCTWTEDHPQRTDVLACCISEQKSVLVRGVVPAGSGFTATSIARGTWTLLRPMNAAGAL